MYAWIWRNLPGAWPAKAALAASLALIAALVLWYVVFPWLEPKFQFDQGVVRSTPSGQATRG
ncbi:hypothetical protein [Spirillospora albida]|uniref:hypothetical protein n=1 Tax=Spirillospora albida TaxID=58123 RepID=UPI0004C1133F|nr:hypothetical protein [Spirillospora albida]